MNLRTLEMKVTGAQLALPGTELTLMAWVLMDDQYPIHRKVAGLSDTAFRLHSAAIFWCRRNGTDGFVSEEDLDQVCAQVRTPARFAAECVHRGTWHLADHACASESCPAPRPEPGWVLHDYLQYQPTKDEDEAKKRKEAEQKSAGGKLGNHRRWHVGPAGKPNPGCPWCTDTPESDSDRSPIGGSDRTPIAPSLSHLSVVDVGNQSPGRNARSDPVQPPLLVIASLADRFAHVLDDDDLLKAVIDSIHHRTGRTLTAAEARKIAADVLGASSRPVGNPAAYLQKTIAAEKDPTGRWPAPGAEPGPKTLPSWCGQCRESTRRLEDEDGYDAGPCPRCNPKARAS